MTFSLLVRRKSRVVALCTLLLCFLAGTVSATTISLGGYWNYQFTGTSAVLTIDRITNTATNRSGTLRLELWAFATPYAGTSQSGYRLATHQLDTLNAGASFTNVSSGPITTSFPPAGTWHVALLVSEYSGSQWVTVAYYLSFATYTLVCSGGSCSTVQAPAAASLTTSRSSYDVDGSDELVLSGNIEAGTAAGSKVDVYIQAQVNGGNFYYLNPARNWGLTRTPLVSGFTLANVSAPNFYRLKLGGLPIGTYTFSALVVNAGSGVTSPLGSGSVQASFLAPPKPSFSAFNGKWTGTYAGTASGQVSFTVQDNLIQMTQPAQGQGPLELAAVNANGSFFTQAATGSCNWTGPFLPGGARQSSASGLWTCNNGTSGTWTATRTPPPAPVPTAGPFDGTYDFSFVHNVPNGTTTVPLSRFLIVKNGIISSSDGLVSGTVTDAASGAIQFTGACWDSYGLTATWTGFLSAGSPKSGQGTYTCQNGIPGGTWRATNGF